MEFLNTFVGKVLDFTVVPVGRQFGYVLFYGSNIRELKKEAEKLKAARKDVESKVGAAQNNYEVINETVQLWKGRVDEIIEKAETFFEEDSPENTGCSHKSCPNLWLRYKLSRKVKKMKAEVDQLRGEGNFDRVSTHQMLPQCIGPSSVVEGAFESRVSTTNEIMEALADPAVHVIGLHGLGGVGKTTLAKQVAKKAQDEKLFDKVLVVEVKHYMIKEIQNQIADMVGLKLDMQSESEDIRASLLRPRLEQEKSLLVVLDDLWKRLDLNQVGLPSVNERNSRCKFILTSRNVSLLSSQMNCKKNFVVGLLSEEEAWVLLKEMAAINEHSDDPDLVSKATEVSRKCARLPVAIVAVARALRNNKNLVDWKDALRRLNNYSSRNNSEIEEVDSSIKLSYDYLKSVELKSTFLLSAMFSQDPLITELFIYAVGLGFLEGVHDMEAARERLDALVHQLKASSLLLDSYSEDRFTVHDVVRDVALSIAFMEQHAVVKRREKVGEWPNEYKPESCIAICLDQSDIEELPESLYGPKVEFFYLKSKDPKLDIPSGFFNGMQEVKVLSFSNMTFSSLPSSMSLLNKLVTLSLHSCTLEDIALVEHLKKLKILNLSWSRIKQLPGELRQLSRLKILNLSYCYQLEVIPPNILSNLKELEELYMRGSFNRWEAEGLNEEGKKRASLDELMHLQKLSALDIQIPNASVLPKDLFLGNPLERYDISIGTDDHVYYDCEFSRRLTLVANNNINMKYGVFRLFERVEALTLENFKGIASLEQIHVTAQSICNLRAIKVKFFDQLKSLFAVSMARTLAKLEKIEVSKCKSLEEILAFVDEENVGEGSDMNVIELPQLHSLTLDDLPVLTNFCFSNKVTFPKLETLILTSINCPNIWDIFTSKSSGTQSHVAAQTFCKLGRIKVSSCDQLKSLFLVSMAGILSRLERIEVSKCKSLEEIVAFEDDGSVEKGSTMNAIEFLQLRFLKLNELPALTDFCFSDQVAFPKLESLSLVSVNCHNIWRIPTSTGSQTQIVEIVESSQTRTLFNDLLPDRSFSNLKTLKVEKCHFLLKLIPLPILKSLGNLEKLEIRDCNSLEVVFDFGEANNYKEDMLTSKSSGIQTFCKLRTIKVRFCDQLKSLFSVSMAGMLSKLERIEVEKCKCLEEIVASAKNENVEKGSTMNVIELLQLRYLELKDLPQLIGFCFNKKVAFPTLETLSLASVNCHNIWHIPTSTGSHSQIVEIVESSQTTTLFNDLLPYRSFSNLKTLRVKKCDFLSKLIPLHILKSLSNLEELEIRDCNSLEVVFDFEEFNNYKEAHTFGLKTLLLSNLPALEDVLSRSFRGIVSFQSLQKLEIGNCDKCEIFQIVDEKVFPKLEELKLNGGEAKMMWNGEFRAYHFSTVKVLSLSGIYDKAATFPYSLFYGFPKLEQLHVSRSSFLVIFSCPKRLLDNDVRKVTSIKRLELFSMNKLKHIWDGKYQSDHILQNLQALQVFNCHRLINLGPSFVSLENLTELYVSYCSEMVNLLTSSTARTLVQLTSLKIKSCKKMEEIIANGEDDVANEIVFVKLKKLTLDELPNCKNFCCHNHTFNFPLLDAVTIENCPKFRTFCLGILITPLLKDVKVRNEEIHLQNDLNNTIQQLFDDKGSLFAELDYLNVKSDEYPELIDVWNGKFASGQSFAKLTSLVMDNCSFLSNHVIPSYVLTSFVNLQRLKVRNCDSVEVVFDLEDIDIDKEAHMLRAPPLEYLKIKHLPNLKYVWNKDLGTIHCVQHLWSVTVCECENLRSIFPASIAEGLTNLSQLKIESCGIEVIVAENQTPTSTIHFEFPKLKLLELIKLPNLKNFYPQRHTVEWPELKMMYVKQCKNVKVFSWEEPEITEKKTVENDQYPFFLFEKVVPQLSSLVLNQNHVKKIWNGQIQEDIFKEVEFLTLDSFYEDKPLDFPYTFVERFPKLRSLIIEVTHCPFKTIFPCEGHLVPSSALFDKLRRLNVSNCHCLSYLLTTLIAKSLVHLTHLVIEDCKMMEEIVTNKGEDVENKIVLKRLKYVELIDLSDLKSFSSQKCTFEFPSLTSVTIRGCFKMKMFCPKVLITPLLEDMKIEENEERWEGDLNKTLEKLFLEKEGHESLKS